VKDVVVFGQEAVELTSRNDDAVLAQLFQQQRLGDLGVVILVENVDHAVGAKVPAVHRQHARRQRRQHRAALGQVITGAQVLVLWLWIRRSWTT